MSKAREEDGNHFQWNGTVWKAIYKFRCTRSDLDICVLDWDEGCGVIRKGSQTLYPFNNIYYDYNYFNLERTEALNIIHPAEFDSWLDRGSV